MLEKLLRAETASPEEVWQTYAEIMRVQTGADAVAVQRAAARRVPARQPLA